MKQRMKYGQIISGVIVGATVLSTIAIVVAVQKDHQTKHEAHPALNVKPTNLININNTYKVAMNDGWYLDVYSTNFNKASLTKFIKDFVILGLDTKYATAFSGDYNFALIINANSHTMIAQNYMRFSLELATSSSLKNQGFAFSLNHLNSNIDNFSMLNDYSLNYCTISNSTITSWYTTSFIHS